ncbi:redoxin domain-containing protein [Puteibacter caeruleilacunae]|nr:redoxin domain-containing protein [Puteibacter caeruleilacunae]
MKKKIALLYCLLLFCFSIQLKAKETRIFGNAPSYASKEIVFFTLPDHITLTPQKYPPVKVSPTGDFSFTVDCKETAPIYLDLEKLQGFLFIQPSHEYKILLPPFTGKTAMDKANAYFKPTPIHIKVVDAPANSLNKAINKLEFTFNNALQRSIQSLVYRKSKAAKEQLLKVIDDQSTASPEPYYKAYQQYLKDYTEALTFSGKEKEFVQQQLSSSPVGYEYSCYKELFELVAKNYLKTSKTTINNTPIQSYINQGNYNMVAKALKSVGISSVEFSEYLMLQNLYSGFFNNYYSRKGILKIIEHIKNNTSSKRHQLIASNIYNKLTMLAEGSVAPTFELLNNQQELVKLNQLKGKYIYLCFLNTSERVSQEMLKFLTQLNGKYSEQLEIVCLAFDKDFEAASKLFKDKGYQFKLLKASGHEKLMQQYNVVTFPAFVLLDKDATIKAAPARSPTENFEKQLVTFLHQDRLSRFKSQSTRK